MANENMEIGDIVKKCKILLLDIEGTTTSISFVKDKLFPYAEENVKQFLDSQWETDDVKEAVNGLRKLALEDQEQSLEGVVAIPGEDASKEDQIEGLVSSVKWQMSNDRKVGALKHLQGLIWKQGYDKGEIKGHVYDDVSPALQQWRSVENQKVYIYSSGSVRAQQLLFGQSVAGDLLPHIDGHFDTTVGPKQEAASYKAIAEKIGCKPDEILFLTDILKEAEAAREAGLNAALVTREGNAPLPAEATSFPQLNSMAQLTVSYKRKTDPQDEQPAKVLKTDVDKDVKSNVDSKIGTNEKETMVTEQDIIDAERMEVESSEKKVESSEEKVERMPENKSKDSVPVESTSEKNTSENTIADNNTPEQSITEENKPQEVNKQTELIVEPVTESVEIMEETICDIQPVIDEADDSSNIKQTDPDVDTNKETVNKNDNTSDSKTVIEELPTEIVTEIEELSNDKQLEDVGEIIDDIEPMIEEPMSTEDIDELKNVGEVLEKECDEILSKVQDVTNLATISSKSTLNPIIEETMEIDNTDSNDIVNSILEKESELENKQEKSSDIVTASAQSDDILTEKEVIDKKTIEEESAKKEIELDITVSKEMTESETLTKESNNLPSNNEKMETQENIVVNDGKSEIKDSNEIESSTCNAMTDNLTQPAQTPSEEKVTCISVESTQENAERSVMADRVITKIDPDSTNETVDNKVIEIPVTESSDEAPTTEKKSDERIKSSQTEAVIDNDKKEKTIANITDISSTESNGEQNKIDKQQESQIEDKSSVETNPIEDTRPETDRNIQVNGKATTNGNVVTVMNGDGERKDKELSSRLSVENGKEVMNGKNGETGEVEQGNGESKIETEIPDIKVKTITTDEPHADPVEQPAQA